PREIAHAPMGTAASDDSPPAGAAPTTSVQDALVRRELDAILASASFHDAELLRRFLRYSVEETLCGRGHALKEYRLGVEVFGRDASFDPRLDPCVRMAARRLRDKLAEYYKSEGSCDAVRIEIPKGGYEASFAVSRSPAQPAARAAGRPAIRSVAVLPFQN